MPRPCSQPSIIVTKTALDAFASTARFFQSKRTRPVDIEIDDLPERDEIIRRFKECGEFVRKHKLRTCFHPDQFVVLNSPRPDVVIKSIQELEYQAEVAEWVGADVVNIHGGGAYGDKQQALGDFAET